MKRIFTKYFSAAAILLISLGTFSCQEDEFPDLGEPSPIPPAPFDINNINDTYGGIAPYQFRSQWGPYNVHDPSIIKEGDYFYCYGTDVGYGTEVPPGIQVRRSKDLIEWQYVGLAFNGVPKMGADYIKANGAEPFQALWAPYIMKVGNEFRLYYSLSSSVGRLSAIGLATSSSPTGPWVEKGLVVTSKADNTRQTNAIDPTVVVTPSGEHWFYYGSAWDGIYVMKLDPATGLAATSGDKGVRIVQRGFTGNNVNGNLEGPEIIYNSENGYYYLFLSYDWLQTKYNVRVGRSRNPQGPFLDFFDRDMNGNFDSEPMILAPYKFGNHGGWQGVSHPSVFKEKGQYFMAHQGRPSVDSYFMVLHVREIFWTPEQWPVVSPERYAGIEQTPVTQSEIAGTYEQILMFYRVVPGYADEQISPDLNTSFEITLNADGTIGGDPNNKWTYNAPILSLAYSNGFTDKVIVKRGRDWENKIAKTIVYTGMNGGALGIWGKKKQ